MRQLDEMHPEYGLASHKGYATPEHRRALKQHGPCALHRQTFAPVALSTRTTVTTQSLFEDDAVFEDVLLEPADLEECADWA